MGLSGTCPRCARILPAGPAKANCDYCGTPLDATPTRNPALGFGFTARPARDPLVNKVIAGRFKIEELIGQGGMGKVYRARHLALDRIVCLKMLKTALLEDPTLVGRFEREAKAASRLNHPNGIQVLDFGRNDADGSLYIVMEYVQGKDLRIVLRDEWPLPEERLCNIMAQALDALTEAHAHNVIHRDLKPENIMVEERRDHSDFVKVLDFGIAKILDSDAPGLTRNDVVCGTPQYMAPEQATGSTLDARCDLYAIGVILYQMTTGHLPFDGQNSMEVLTRHVNEVPVPPRKRQPDAPISEAMEALILRALEKDPAYRPQSAQEFRMLLLDVAKKRAPVEVNSSAPTQPAAALPAPPGPAAVVASRTPAGKSGRPRRIAASVGGASLAMLLLAGALLSGRRSASVQTAPGVAAASPIATTTGTQSAPQQPGAQAAATRPHDPAKARNQVQRAADWQAANDTGTARDLLEKAIEADPDNAEAHYRLGGLFQNSQVDRARHEYELARKLNPQKYADNVDMILKSL